MPEKREHASRSETPDAGERGIYLYGIGRRWAGEESPLTEFDDGDEEVFTIVTGDLVAFVKYVPLADYSEEALRERVQDEAWLLEAAQSHHQMVTRIYQQVPMLPAKFGSIYQSEDALREALDDSHQQLSQRLDIIEGRDEWAVHVFREGESLGDETLANDPELRQLRDELERASEGRAYLLQRQLQTRLERASEQYELGLVRSLFGDLQQWASAIQLEDPRQSTDSVGADTEVSRASVLVRREHAEAFLDAADRAANARRGIRIEISGPWPAYSFTQEETGG